MVTSVLWIAGYLVVGTLCGALYAWKNPDEWVEGSLILMFMWPIALPAMLSVWIFEKMADLRAEYDERRRSRGIK